MMERDADLDCQIARVLGYKEIPGIAYDYDGAIENPPVLLVPPDFVQSGFAYPGRGIVPTHYHVPNWSNSEARAMQLLKEAVLLFGSAEHRLWLRPDRKTFVHDVILGHGKWASNEIYSRAVCFAVLLAAQADKELSAVK